MAHRRRKAERHPVYENVLLWPDRGGARGGRCRARGWMQQAEVSDAVLRKTRSHELYRLWLESAVIEHTEALRPFFDLGLSPGAAVSTARAGFFVHSRCAAGGRLQTFIRLLTEAR